MDKKLILNALQRYYGFKKDVDFAEFLGISGQLLSKWKARNTFDVEILHTKCTEISSDYLLSGEGPILKRDLNILNEPSSNYPSEEQKLIPLYDDIVTVAMQKSAMMDSTLEAVEMIDAGDWFRDATAAMRVHSDSMSPEYKSGSIVALREVLNKNLVIYGQDYLLETSEYRVIKRLQKSDLPENWLACSINEEKYESTGRLIHEPFNVHINDVIRLYQVLGHVKRNQSSIAINKIIK